RVWLVPRLPRANAGKAVEASGVASGGRERKRSELAGIDVPTRLRFQRRVGVLGPERRNREDQYRLEPVRGSPAYEGIDARPVVCRIRRVSWIEARGWRPPPRLAGLHGHLEAGRRRPAPLDGEHDRGRTGPGGTRERGVEVRALP